MSRAEADVGEILKDLEVAEKRIEEFRLKLIEAAAYINARDAAYGKTFFDFLKGTSGEPKVTEGGDVCPSSTDGQHGWVFPGEYCSGCGKEC